MASHLSQAPHLPQTQLPRSPPSPQALFHVLIMFILYHKQQYNSALGNHYLYDPALSLAEVVEAPPGGAGGPAANVRPQSVFGWWYPPSEVRGAAAAGGAAASPASAYGTPRPHF